MKFRKRAGDEDMSCALIGRPEVDEKVGGKWLAV